MLMKTCILIAIVLFTLLLLPYGTVYSQNQTEYKIQINSDCSATWTIQQIGTNVSIDPTFQSRLSSLINATESITGRNMTEILDSITWLVLSGSYVEVQYKFQWMNFSKKEGAKIIIGDVFQVKDFFDQLYGDGQVDMTYPSQYVIESKTEPLPYIENDSSRTLVWPGTDDFKDGKPTIVLTESSSTSGFLEAWQNIILIAGLSVLAAGSLIGFYAFKLRKKREKEIRTKLEVSSLGIESNEDRIVKILKSSGGSLYQSAIAEQCKFSKAKTSQLLATLEDKGIVTRYKRGRDKIVVLNEQEKK